MPIATKYLFVVLMDVRKDKEALFNEVYDTEHVPLILKVPGVRAASRMKTEPAAFNIGGEHKVLDGGGMDGLSAALHEQGMNGEASCWGDGDCITAIGQPVDAPHVARRMV